jgi:hypothetical protein
VLHQRLAFNVTIVIYLSFRHVDVEPHRMYQFLCCSGLSTTISTRGN